MPYLGPGVDNGYRSRFIYTATAGQTSFSGGDANGITLTYTDSEYLDVYQNGVLLVPGDDYAATTGTTVVLVQGASLNDKVEMIQYQAFGVADTVSRADGGAFGGNISTSGTFTASGIIKTDDTTDATSTTDGSLQTDGGLSVAKDIVGGDDILLKSDTSTIHFGADSEINIQHSHNDGLNINRTTATDNTPVSLNLRSGENDISDGETIGQITFSAPSDDAGGDANLVCAGILARAGGTFSSTSNKTELDFLTGSSEAATRKIMIGADGGLLEGKTDTSSATEGTRLFAGVGSHATTNGGTVFVFNRGTNDGTLINLNQANNNEGSISVSGSTVSYNAFSGSHWSRLSDNSQPTILKGTVIETIDEMCDWYKFQFTVAATKDKDIAGNEIDGTPEYVESISCALPAGKKVGDTVSYTHTNGITYDAVYVKEDDNKHTKCKISDTADSKRVYGVFAAWDADDDNVNDMYVTAVGTHVVRINKDITVSAGDLLVSNGDGTAKKLGGDTSMTADVYSSIIGKVLTNIKQETYSDGSYTVPCALYCG
ncbi:hypothetical protein [uncultured Mediterranean phage]|nr:hypothetical protein [uncultured Mediterranean phage]